MSIKPAGRESSTLRALSLIALAAAAALLTWRAVLKTPQGWDFAHVYNAARTFLAGGDPYDRAGAAERWRAMRVPAPLPDDISGFPLLLPPSTVLLMAPFAPLPPLPAWRIFQALSLALVIVMAAMAIRMARLPIRRAPALFLAAWFFAMGPLHSGIHAGQPAMWCIAATLAGLLLACRPDGSTGGREIGAGILLGLATALKPQLGGPFVVYLALRRQWRAATWAAALSAGLLLIAAAWLQAHVGPGWISHWLQSLAEVAAPGGLADYGPTSRTRTHMVNLQLLLAAFISSRTVVNVLSVLLALLAAAVIAARLWRDRNRRIDPLLSGAAVAVVLLLPVYHRYYDATILLLVAAWIVKVLSEREGPSPRLKFLAAACIVPMGVFFLPLAWVDNATRRGLVPRGVAASAPWEWFIVPHQVWALAALAVLLLAALRARGLPELEGVAGHDDRAILPDVEQQPGGEEAGEQA